MSIEYNFKGHLIKKTSKSNICKSFKMPSFDAATIEWFTVCNLDFKYKLIINCGPLITFANSLGSDQAHSNGIPERIFF